MNEKNEVIQKSDKFSSRRQFIKQALKVGGTVSLSASLTALSACADKPPILRQQLKLVKDPQGLCDLPEGFTYKVLSEYEQTMDDQHSVPNYHDGMGCFEGANGEIVLVRNHEVSQYFPSDPSSPIPEHAYDKDASGGTTTLILDKDLNLRKQFISLTGTIRNCGGGKTPWNTWISSEEVDEGFWQNGTWEMGKPHGYNFEVDPFSELKKAEPLKDMGRFRHEAIAVDPRDGIVYQTEDNPNGCLYRFIPNQKGKLANGGKLQALKIVNPHINHSSAQTMPLNQAFTCTWVDIDQPDPKTNTVAQQAIAKGACIFVRGEGIVYENGDIYFACTAGGQAGLGQFFKYTPNNTGGQISLIFESTKGGILENPDNITMNKFGDLIICEDNKMHEQCLVGLQANGHIYYIAANTLSEWAGACFSPDGNTLFANIYRPGKTLAITGPWENLRSI